MTKKPNTTANGTSPPAGQAVGPGALVWKEYSIHLSDLPQASILSLAQRGFTHILGNEVAAYESGLKSETVVNDGETAAKYSPSEVAVMAHDRRMAKLAEMASGTLGQGRSSGPRLPRLDRVMRDVAKETVAEAFRKTGKAASMPKAADSKAWAAYIDKYLSNPENAAKAQAEAQRRIAAPSKMEDAEAAEMLASL